MPSLSEWHSTAAIDPSTKSPLPQTMWALAMAVRTWAGDCGTGVVYHFGSPLWRSFSCLRPSK